MHTHTIASTHMHGTSSLPERPTRKVLRFSIAWSEHCFNTSLSFLTNWFSVSAIFTVKGHFRWVVMIYFTLNVPGLLSRCCVRNLFGTRLFFISTCLRVLPHQICVDVATCRNITQHTWTMLKTPASVVERRKSVYSHWHLSFAQTQTRKLR